MSRPMVTIVDYGRSNLLSVQRALEHCGADVCYACTAEEVEAAKALVLPGVGAFADGMARLRQNGLDRVLIRKAEEGTPFLGICLGMQMLLDSSTEGGLTRGLGLIPGTVEPISPRGTDGSPLKVPHVGWGALALGPGAQQGPMCRTREGDEVYFVHSFAARPQNPKDCIAVVHYGGHAVCAAVQHGRVTGLQFHPEKSGPVGLEMIRAFLEQI